MIAQHVIDLAERFADVLSLLPVSGLQAFAGVGVEERQRALGRDPLALAAKV